jgi:tetratricopeptide (TPR) repeat protein
VHNRAIVAAAQGEYERAWALYEESLRLARGMELEHGEAVIAAALSNMGDLARRRGDYTRARPLLEESLALRRRHGNTFGAAVVLADLADLLRAQGDEEQAVALYRESLTLYGAPGFTRVRTVAQCLEGIAHIAAARGQPDRAARLAGAAAALRHLNGTPLEPDQRADYEWTVQAARAALGDAAFASAWAQGQELLPQQAVAEASSLRIVTA